MYVFKEYLFTFTSNNFQNTIQNQRPLKIDLAIFDLVV